MRVLLTGTGGFIGAHTVQWILQNTDWDIVGLESWRPAHINNAMRLHEVFSELTQELVSRYQGHQWDLTHEFTEPIKNLIFEKPIDVIISMASDSRVTHSVKHPGETWYNNTQIAFNMLELARHNPVKMFIQVSTDEVYGDAGWDSPGHPEWDTILPSNPYSRAW